MGLSIVASSGSAHSLSSAFSWIFYFRVGPVPPALMEATVHGGEASVARVVLEAVARGAVLADSEEDLPAVAGPVESGKYKIIFRKGARVVEWAALERLYTRKGIKGSNPFLSAKKTC